MVRGEPVVRGVLAAAIEELGRTGYGALRIEDVAARAGVNKTTVYRRWPTKEDLVRAALLSITADKFVVPNTGSLRGDLLAIAHRMVETTRSLGGQGLLRLMIAEGPGSELVAIAKSLRKTHEAVPRSVIEAAQARGELPPDADAMLLFDVLVAALNRRLFLDRQDVDDAYLGRLVDLLLLGALGRDGGSPSPSGQKGRRRAP